MKKLLVCALAALILLGVSAALADGAWYCPRCGRLNYENFCPSDGTARPQSGSSSARTIVDGGEYNYSNYAGLRCTLNTKMATRTGPGTNYDEPGTFLSSGSTVTVLSKAYDDRNEVWWVQVEFTVSGARYRAYTGAKRLNGLNLSSVPQELVIGTCTLSRSATGYYGPGDSYQKIKRTLPSGVKCSIYGYAYGGNSDYILIEFYDRGISQYRRAWIQDWMVDDYTMYYGF